MRYLLCFIFPPFAVAASGRPLTALLNLVLTCCFILPGVIHAIFVVHSYNSERRHAETLSAITGKPVPMRDHGEWTAFGVVIIAVMLILAGGLWWTQSQRAHLSAIKQAQSQQAAKASAELEKRQHMQATAQAAMEGRSLMEIEATHGAATVKDKATGWAEWPKFRARFADGKAVEIQTR